MRLISRHRILLMALGFVVGERFVSAQSQQSGLVFTARTSVIEIPVRVSDNNGTPVTGLQAENFSVRVDGAPREVVATRFVSLGAGPRLLAEADSSVVPRNVISNRSIADAERAIVFVIDPDPRILPLFERVLNQMFSDLSARDLVAVVYPRRSDLSVDFTDDPARLRQSFSHLREASDRSDLRATSRALENALIALKPVPTPQRLVVWVSGGFSVPLLPAVHDAEGPVDGLALAKARGLSDEVYRLLDNGARHGIPIYAVDPAGLQDGRTTATELLRVVSLGTRGRAVVGRSDVVAASGKLLRDAEDYYVLGIRLPSGQAPRTPNSLSVEVSNRPDLNVEAPRGFVQPAEAPTDSPRSHLLTAIASGGVRTDIEIVLAATPLGPATSGRTAVVVTAEIRVPFLSSSADPPERLSLDYVATAIDSDARILDSTNRHIGLARGSAGRPLVVTDYLELRPGRAYVRLGVVNTANSAAGTVSLGIDVPRFNESIGAIGGLILGSRVDATVAWDARPEQLPFAPTPVRAAAPGERLMVYARLFGGGPDHAVLKLIGDEEVMRVSLPVTLITRDGAALREVQGQIQIPAVLDGRYTLELEWHDSAGGMLTKSVPLLIRETLAKAKG